MTRTDILNAVIERTGARSYLEIGVRNPADNFFRVRCARKTGVDPANERALGVGWAIHPMTSAQYAATSPPPVDIIFIDGDHTAAGAAYDLATFAPLCRLALVAHDCWPGEGEDTGPVKPADGRPWCGGVWQAWSAWCCESGPWRRYLSLDDHGVGVAIRTASPRAPRWPQRPPDLAVWLGSWWRWCEPWR